MSSRGAARRGKILGNRDISAKKLAMYADNPIRYCNLRGQLEGAGGTTGVLDNDQAVRKDALFPILAAIVGFSLMGTLVAALTLADLIHLGLGRDDGLVAMVMLLVSLILIGAAGFGLFRRSRIRHPDEVCERFDLDPREYKVVSASIMGNRGRLYRVNRICAVPHALFLRTKGHRSYHVALLLSRPYSGKVHDADLFRLTLQMGVIRRALGVRMVSGSIRYAGKLVKVAYSDSLYTSLQRLGTEYEHSVSRWWPENRLSFRDRQRVAVGEVGRSSAIDWPDEYSI